MQKVDLLRGILTLSSEQQCLNKNRLTAPLYILLAYNILVGLTDKRTIICVYKISHYSDTGASIVRIVRDFRRKVNIPRYCAGWACCCYFAEAGRQTLELCGAGREGVIIRLQYLWFIHRHSFREPQCQLVTCIKCQDPESRRFIRSKSSPAFDVLTKSFVINGKGDHVSERLSETGIVIW